MICSNRFPYKGAAQAMTDLLAGQMHMTIEGATTLLAHIQSGKVRPLAVMSPQRMPALPHSKSSVGTSLPITNLLMPALLFRWI